MLEIARDIIGNRQIEAASLSNLGSAYHLLEQYKQGIEVCQQSLKTAQDTSDRPGEAIVWFNLGKALAELEERKSEAIAAYQKALKLFQAMELNEYVQLTDNEIQQLVGVDLVASNRSAETHPQSAPWEELVTDSH